MRLQRTSPVFAFAALAFAACGHPAAATVDSAVASDAAGDGGAIDAAPTGCPGLAFCDGFESYPAGPLTNGATLGAWSVSAAGVTIAIDATSGYHGGKALHVTAPAGAAAHGYLAQKAAAGLVPGNDLHGRAMIFYANTGGNDLPLHVHSWFFLASGASTALSATAAMNLGGGGAKLQLNYSPGDHSVQGGAMTAGAWHCVQWQYDGSGTPPANQAKVWIDGALAITIPAAQSWSFATPWSAFDFGFTHYQTLANPVDVLLDDFALSNATIACP